MCVIRIRNFTGKSLTRYGMHMGSTNRIMGRLQRISIIRSKTIRLNGIGRRQGTVRKRVIDQQSKEFKNRKGLVQMNYIKEIDAFHIKQETDPLTSAAAYLWFVLMDINSRTGWKEEFSV